MHIKKIYLSNANTFYGRKTNFKTSFGFENNKNAITRQDLLLQSSKVSQSIGN